MSTADDTPQLPPPPPPSGARPPAAAELNTKAVVALVLAIAFWGVGSLVAVVLGPIALREIDAGQGRQAGRPLARAAIALGWLGLVVIAVVLAAALFAVRESARQGGL